MKSTAKIIFTNSTLSKMLDFKMITSKYIVLRICPLFVKQKHVVVDHKPSSHLPRVHHLHPESENIMHYRLELTNQLNNGRSGGGALRSFIAIALETHVTPHMETGPLLSGPLQN